MYFLIQTPEPTDQQHRFSGHCYLRPLWASIHLPIKWEPSLWSSLDPLGEKTLFCGMFTVARAVSQWGLRFLLICAVLKWQYTEGKSTTAPAFSFAFPASYPLKGGHLWAGEISNIYQACFTDLVQKYHTLSLSPLFSFKKKRINCCHCCTHGVLYSSFKGHWKEPQKAVNLFLLQRSGNFRKVGSLLEAEQVTAQSEPGFLLAPLRKALLLFLILLCWL